MSKISDLRMEAIAREMGVLPAEITERKMFLEFENRDIEILIQVRDMLDRDPDGFYGSFYTHLLQFAEPRELLAEPGTMERLRKEQAAYFRSLTAGVYDDKYVRDRLRIGVVHQKIGVTPKWYIGAYRKYMSEVMHCLWPHMSDQPDRFIAALDAILKVVSFDMVLALDTYFAADRQALAEKQEQLSHSESHFRLIFSRAPVGIAYISSSGHFVRVNRKLTEILGYDEQELLAMHFSTITSDEDMETTLAFTRRLVSGEIDEYTQEKRYVHRDGRLVWANVSVTTIREASGSTYYVSVVEDITRRKQAEEELLQLASFDPLTRLPNRTLLQDRLMQALSQSKRNDMQVAVMFIDLDRFKNINDSLGHDVGDQVIVEAARRLKQSLRACDTVARHGGDEFVVVLPAITDRNDAALVAQKLVETLNTPMQAGGHELFLTCSIGISLYPDDGDNGQALLKNADTAMYDAKAGGRNCYRFYCRNMNASILARLKMETALRRALEREEFLLHYQPQIDILTGQVTALEALVRWQPHGQDLVGPAEFIPIAEETGLIVEIGDWVLRTACMQHRAWREAGLVDIPIHVNLSARQFASHDLVDRVKKALSRMDCPASCLGLEITESVVMENPVQTAHVLTHLSDMGVHLSIDDFGTGYSSLAYLKRFPIDTLKIDRSFVRDIVTSPDDATIVKSVIALAHSMRLKVVAEGVEDGKQAEFLREHGCDGVQGFLYSRPVDSAQIEVLLRSGAKILA